MKIYTLEARQLLPIGKERCWEFFSDPKNLGDITPPEMGFNILSPQRERMYPGQIIIYRIKVFPMITLTWVTEITQVREYEFFIDEQRFGPYSFWHHQHSFKETGEGTEMTDLVHYALPFGPLGRIMNALIIRQRLNKIFTFRREILKTKFN